MSNLWDVTPELEEKLRSLALEQGSLRDVSMGSLYMGREAPYFCFRLLDDE